MSEMKYKEIVAQIEKLQKKAADARRAETSDTVAKIWAIMQEFGITLDDLRSGKPRKGKRSGRTKRADNTNVRKVAPKYRDPKTGTEWTGRGRQPKWLVTAIGNGASLESFLIAHE